MNVCMHTCNHACVLDVPELMFMMHTYICIYSHVCVHLFVHKCYYATVHACMRIRSEEKVIRSGAQGVKRGVKKKSKE